MMETIFNIALVFSAHEWVESFHRYCTNTGDLSISSLVYDPVILYSETCDACVISDAHPSLSRGLVDHMHAQQRCVLAVCDENNSAHEFLSNIGVDAIFSERLPSDELAREIREFLATTEPQIRPIDDLPVVETPVKTATGFLHGIIGTGGSGSTEVTLQLAHRLVDCVLVDGDMEHSSIAPRLALPVEPHLLNSLEAARYDPDQFHSTIQHSEILSVIVGVSHSSYARDISEEEVRSFLDCLRLNYTHSVIDLGRVSDNSSFSELYRTITHQCDKISLIGEGTPVGIIRLLETVSFLHSDKTSVSPIEIVINKFPKNGSVEHDITREFSDIERVHAVHFLPLASDLFIHSWRAHQHIPQAWKKPMDKIVLFHQEPLQDEVHVIDHAYSSVSECEGVA